MGGPWLDSKLRSMGPSRYGRRPTHNRKPRPTLRGKCDRSREGHASLRDTAFTEMNAPKPHVSGRSSCPGDSAHRAAAYLWAMPEPAASAARATLSRELSEFLIELSIALHPHPMYPHAHPSLDPAASA